MRSETVNGRRERIRYRSKGEIQRSDGLIWSPDKGGWCAPITTATGVRCGDVVIRPGTHGGPKRAPYRGPRRRPQ